MSWFLFALICTLGWGLADVFYKKSSDENDRYSHLRIAVSVGLVMGVVSFALLPFSESGFSFSALIKNAVKYAPASLGYIVSMVIGYAGMRYLEISIISPVQNASGALSMAAILTYFLVTGKIERISDEFSSFDLIGTVLIIIGVIGLAVAENRLSRGAAAAEKTEKKYRFGALALLFPILYCVFDTVGTVADGILLDGETGLGLGELDVLILYGLTFFTAGIIALLFLFVKEKKWYVPFVKSERPKLLAALCEEFGQVFYVYAMAARPVIAAPMIASYCIVSVILSRIFLKEKMKPSQNVCVLLVIAGIVLLGIAEGLAA